MSYEFYYRGCVHKYGTSVNRKETWGISPWISPGISQLQITGLDDGKIFTGKPDQFDGKNPWVSG
jgi:hypothetical protein